MVTETTTEWKEATDDSGFSDFANDPKWGLSSNLSGGPSVAATEETSSSSSEDEKEETFQEEALKAHNDYRAKHGVPPLKLDKKVNCIYPRSMCIPGLTWLLLMQ